MADPAGDLVAKLQADVDAITRRRAQVRAASEAAARTAARLWESIDPEAIADGWAAVEPQAFASTSVGQVAAAQGADSYVDDVWRALDGGDPGAQGQLVPRRLGGVASDGRSLVTLLRQAPVRALMARSRGATTDEAMAVGRNTLLRIVGTQVTDAARAAEQIGLTSRARIDWYVRMLQPPSCSRCAVLAGKRFRWNTGFQRHPLCDCTHIPAPEQVANDLTTNPRAYFDSLDRADQDRLFTRGGAQAIRDGADVSQVVNTRRAGMFDRATGTTSEGVRRKIGRRRGDDWGQPQKRYGRAGRAMDAAGIAGPRLMPEHIYALATSREQAIAMLREYGYLT